LQIIKALRQELGLSQQQLAELAGVDKVTLIRIETGRGNPTVETLGKLATALGVEMADLFPKAQRPLFPELPDTATQEERQGRRPWRSEAEEYIRQNEGLLSDPELTYAVSSKLFNRSVDRLAEVNEAIRAADRDEDFPLAELNEMERAFDRYHAFCAKAAAAHDRRFEGREVTDKEAEAARKRMRQINSDRGVA
jgi:transcriptional regulator with XRE-family HTH domain